MNMRLLLVALLIAGCTAAPHPAPERTVVLGYGDSLLWLADDDV